MSLGIIEKSYLTDIASAIRQKTGEASTYTPSQMSTAINNIPTGGGNLYFDDWVELDLSEASSNGVLYCNNYAFRGCTALTNISLPNCSYIGSYAFFNCSSLTTANIPNCESIGGSAFYLCSLLTDFRFPKCNYIGSCAFQGCKSITEVNTSLCSYIGWDAFSGCTALTNVSLPTCSYVEAGAFSGCTALTNVSLPNVSAMGNCAFKDCSNLSEIYLLYNSVCTLYSSYVFSGTGITSSTGSIYVPASLVSGYQTESYWSYYSTQFVGV